MQPPESWDDAAKRKHHSAVALWLEPDHFRLPRHFQVFGFRKQLAGNALLRLVAATLGLLNAFLFVHVFVG